MRLLDSSRTPQKEKRTFTDLGKFWVKFEEMSSKIWGNFE